MKKFLFFLPILTVLLGAGCETRQAEPTMTFQYPNDTSIQNTQDVTNESAAVSWEFPGELAPEEIQHKQIRIQTAKGNIVFELFADTAPLTVSNFVYLTTGGYYNGLVFHRRDEGFVIQGGDPNGNGTGGPGYAFADELSDDYTYQRGIVAMANRGPDTNGSQFFIMLEDSDRLSKDYTIFGRVMEGMDVVDQIAVGDTMLAVTVESR